MTALDKNPETVNLLNPTNFRFFLKKAPNLNFFAQKVEIPGLGLPPVGTPNPFVNIPMAGDHLLYNELLVTFRVDEKLRNYLEIHNWMRGLGFPESFDEYYDLVNVPRTNLGEGVKTDIAVWILNSARNLRFEFTFMDAHPIELSNLPLDATLTEINYVEVNAKFRFTKYEVTAVGT